MTKYSYTPYNPIYPKLYQSEKAIITKIIDCEFKIEHIGSTAVPGLGGKGIVDIYIAVEPTFIGKLCTDIQTIGYAEPKVDGFGDENRKFTKRTIVDDNGNSWTFHVHICPIGYHDFDMCVAFRDFLINNKDYMQKYDEVKQLAVKEADKFEDKIQKRTAYMQIKEPLILEINEKIKMSNVASINIEL